MLFRDFENMNDGLKVMFQPGLSFEAGYPCRYSFVCNPSNIIKSPPQNVPLEPLMLGLRETLYESNFVKMSAFDSSYGVNVDE
jgi:hypothetical protein